LRCRLLGAGELEYPLLGRAVIPGRVVFSVLVGKSGTVDDARVVTGHPLLDRSAEAYVRSLRFEPYRSPRGPKRMEGYFTVIFDLVKDSPVLGQDVPVIYVLEDGSYRAGSGVLSPAQLAACLDANSVTETKKTIHLSPESQMRMKDAMKLLKKYSTTICIHSDGTRE
jgi:TonB family protein